MATTKIWAVKGNLRSIVDYIENPEKTIAEEGMRSLLNVLSYAANSDKAGAFVTGVNCLPEIAIQQMALTKRQYGKTDGILAFHAYQSFKPGEITPQLCHEVGVKLAREMWSDRFQVIVATHMDKSHLHNHFAINSVSYKDGGKYNSCKAATQKLRDVSDRLCKEYGLSVIKHPGKSPPRLVYLAERNGEPTRYTLYRNVIDRAVASAMTKQQFEAILKLHGFEMKLSGTYWTIKMTGDQRATRLYRLGEDYTGAMITKRIYGDGLNKRSVPYPKPKDRHQKIIGTFRHTKVFTGFRALYFTYLYRMGVLPKNRLRPPCHPTLWEDVRKLRKYSAQIRLLAENKIDTSEQLQAFVNSTQPCMDDLIRERTLIQNKLRREKEPEVIEALKTEKAILTAHITPLRRNLSLAAEIEEQTERMKEKLGTIRQLEIQENSRQRRGRAR